MFVRARKLCLVILFPKLIFFYCFATEKESFEFIIPMKTLTKLTVRPQRCCATTRLKHGVMDWRPESIEWCWRGVFYKHTTSAYGGPKRGAFSDQWPEVYSSFPKSSGGRNINFHLISLFEIFFFQKGNTLLPYMPYLYCLLFLHLFWLECLCY
jgi:hypothetical protein